ncbi:spermidine/putrescine ABC transporter [Erysipelothrix amsterdamensis]|uniref:Spermidine/putrescine ABC transporter n=1 Tax=Erysipelothrix amsterdamensis TaxID=2929157 RepID=A0AAU9VHA2_9FIRM|nr:spermidine/putrescine ABC transporter [Erysipelothrix sp. A18Y020d]CAH2761124.1 spermidine/putrescine ABC transporter [Erysipelothrix sp. A18Y020d]
MMGRPKGGLNDKWTYEDRIKVVTRHVDEHISVAKLSQVLKVRLMGGLIDSCAMVKRV